MRAENKEFLVPVSSSDLYPLPCQTISNCALLTTHRTSRSGALLDVSFKGCIDMDSSVRCLLFLDIDGVLNRAFIPEEELMLDEETIIDVSHPAHPSLYLPCVRNLKKNIECTRTKC